MMSDDAEMLGRDLRVILSVAAELLAQTPKLRPEVKRELTQLAEKIQTGLTQNEESMVGKTVPGGIRRTTTFPLYRVAHHERTYLILEPPDEELEDCKKCLGKRVVGTGSQ